MSENRPLNRDRNAAVEWERAGCVRGMIVPSLMLLDQLRLGRLLHGQRGHVPSRYVLTVAAQNFLSLHGRPGSGGRVVKVVVGSGDA